MENISIYIFIVFLADCSSTQNDRFEERLKYIEHNLAEMKAQSEATEARLRTEIDELRSQEERHKESYRLLQLRLETIETSQRQEYDKVKQLENCSNVMNNYVKKRQMKRTQDEIAFFARLGQDKVHLGVEQTVVFDDVVTNIDGTNSPVAYNRHTGVFTAPVSGLYVFSTTILSNYHSTSHFRFYLNNLPITIMYVHGNTSSGWDSASQTVVLDLKRGDAVSVKNTENDQGALGGGHSIFSGFILQQHEGDVIVG